MESCIIFDLDGTLVDSETACLQALNEAIPQLAMSISELSSRYRGKKLATIFSDIETRLGLRLPIDIEQRYREHASILIESGTRLFSGVADALVRLRQPICIASGGPMPKIEMLVDSHGLRPFFGKRLFSSYDLKSWKPSPDLFVHAAHQMGFSPEDCIVVEDSEVGITAANAAGMTPLHFCEQFSAPLSEYSFSNYAELPDMIERIQTA